MKRLMLLAVLGGLSLAAPAQTTPDSAVTIRAYQIELPAVPHRMLLGEYDDYKGAYELSNGDVLQLGQSGRRMYAEMGDGKRHELVAAAPGVFVARDRELKVTLKRDNYGDFSGHILMRVPASSVAQADQGQQLRLLSIR